MLATITDNRFITLSHITPPEEDAVVKHFTIKIENHNRYIDPSQRGSWDGVYRHYNSKKKQLPRPLLASLRAMCTELNYPLSVVDARPPWEYKVADPETIGPDFIKGITLEEYQINAIKIGCRAEVGVFRLPTGAGKCIVSETKLIVNNVSTTIGQVCAGLSDEEIKPVSNFVVRGPGGNIGVNAIYKTNKRTIMRLELCNGLILRGVPEHRVWTKRGWVMLKDLINDDEVATNETQI